MKSYSLDKMIKYYLIICVFSYLIACTNDIKPDVIINPPKPEPKPSNCVIDDSLTKPFLYYHGDTSKGVNSATLNYYYKYIAESYFNIEKNMKLNFHSYMYYDHRNDYIKNRLTFFDLPCTYDTIFLQVANEKANKLGLPIAYFSFDEDDVIYELYDLDSTKRNYIIINSLDTIQRIVQAEYWVQFLVNKPKRRSSSPDVLRFCDGKIRVKY